MDFSKLTKHLPNLPENVTRTAGRAILHGQKNSPTVLFGAGVVGVVATAVLAAKATLKLDDEILTPMHAKLNDINTVKHDDYSDSDRKSDKAIVYTQGSLKIAKLYAPTVAVGVLSITALTGSHVILTKRNVALTAAYKTVENQYAEYKSRVEEELGPKKSAELLDKKVETTTDEDGKETKKKVDAPMGRSQYARFFDELCTSWSPEHDYNRVFLSCKQNYLNDKLRARGHVFLNEVYDELGFDRTKAGAVVGWVYNGTGDSFIDFGMFDAESDVKRDFVNGRERAIILDFNVDGVIYDQI